MMRVDARRGSARAARTSVISTAKFRCCPASGYQLRVDVSIAIAWSNAHAALLACGTADEARLRAETRVSRLLRVLSEVLESNILQALLLRGRRRERKSDSEAERSGESDTHHGAGTCADSWDS